MSYLSTLAARALDSPQPIRPRLPSLFETAAGPRVNFREVTANKLNQSEQRAASRPQDPATALRKSDPIVSTIPPPGKAGGPDPVADELTDRARSIRAVSEFAQASTIQPERMAEPGTDRAPKLREIETKSEAANDRMSLAAPTSSAPELIKPTIQVAQAITIEQTQVIESARDASDSIESRESKTPEPAEIRPQSIVVKPEVSTAILESTFVEPQLVPPDLSPSVKITIGRVDVRAVMPPAPATVTVAQQPAIKALSLDEYLKQRNGEHR
jgi:hypothetical protein